MLVHFFRLIFLSWDLFFSVVIFRLQKMTSTTSEVGITDPKMIIDEACRTAKAFIDRFYDKVDSKRPTLAKIYLDAATLSWNGNRIDGNCNYIYKKTLLW